MTWNCIGLYEVPWNCIVQFPTKSCGVHSFSTLFVCGLKKTLKSVFSVPLNGVYVKTPPLGSYTIILPTSAGFKPVTTMKTLSSSLYVALLIANGPEVIHCAVLFTSDIF